MSAYDTYGRGVASGDTREKGKADYDQLLRRNLLNTYNYMASGVLLTGIVALLCSWTGLTDVMFAKKGPSLLGYAVIFAPLLYVFFVAGAIQSLSLGAARFAFWSFTAVMGLSMSTVFMVYTGTSIATTFFATSAAFAGLSLYGYTTRRDLGPIGTTALMAVWGLIAASLLNLFFRAPAMSYAISAVGILVFAVLTAYDTQKMRQTFSEGRLSAASAERMSIHFALELYLDFLNLFLYLLRFMGARKD